MIRKRSEMISESKCIRGGIGETVILQLLNGPEEMYEKGRMFSFMILQPGNSIGEHRHSGDNEIFWIISGTGEYNDNGTITAIGPGDVAVCNDGELHALINNGDEPLIFVALILYS